jgi:hypothetical protein
MFSLCADLKWNWLPNGGGLYDQDPEMLEAFRYIFSAIKQHEAEEEVKRKREQARKQAGGRRVAGRR